MFSFISFRVNIPPRFINRDYGNGILLKIIRILIKNPPTADILIQCIAQTNNFPIASLPIHYGSFVDFIISRLSRSWMKKKSFFNRRRDAFERASCEFAAKHVGSSINSITSSSTLRCRNPPFAIVSTRFNDFRQFDRQFYYITARLRLLFAISVQ